MFKNEIELDIIVDFRKKFYRVKKEKLEMIIKYNVEVEFIFF